MGLESGAIALVMFGVTCGFLLTGYPVALVLGGVAPHLRRIGYTGRRIRSVFCWVGCHPVTLAS